MFDGLLRLLSPRFRKPPRWNDGAISDDWFRAHFHFATDTIHDWLSPHLDIGRSTLLDFGCGDGTTDLAMAVRHAPKEILGVDIVRTWGDLQKTASREIQLSRWPTNLSFEEISPGQSVAELGRFDAVFSWSAFEHIDRPLLLPILGDLHAALRPGGFLFVQIEPLFYSPFGSHLQRFAVAPWAHLLSEEAELERAVMSYAGEISAKEVEFNYYVRTYDDYKRFIFEQYRGLNRLTVDELFGLLTTAGFEIIREHRCHYPGLDIPEALSTRFRWEDLITNEITVLARRR
jgi:2-polyprenyl-3-methyl-5-hydroxy-6-metoxy-1,4-benzoquinol methylase